MGDGLSVPFIISCPSMNIFSNMVTLLIMQVGVQLLSVRMDQLIPTNRENSITFCVIPDKNFLFSSLFQHTLLY